MYTKTNDELVEMIYAGNDKYDEALQQLIHNLIPMMLKLGRMYLGKIPIYDNDDFIQEGSILIWKKVRDRKWNPGSGRFCNFFYSAFRFHVLHMYRDYVMKNMIKINEDEDYYCYGYRICTLVVDEFAIEYREKQKERNKAWAIKTGRQKPKSDEPMKPKMTPEEKAEKERQRRKEYFAKHREEINAKKHQWYIENREYALQYQKAYDAGVRIGKHGSALYYFRSSTEQLFRYFLRFTAGEAEVLYPDQLRNNLKVFHENALRMYRKASDTKPEN